MTAVEMEAAIQRWASTTGRRIRIDSVGVLIQGGRLEAVVTDLRSGRQGLWPTAWSVSDPVPPPTPPPAVTPSRPSTQRMLF